MRKLQNSELGRLSPEEFALAEKLPVWVILDNVRSLQNIGSIFRTTDAFGLAGIILCGISATPPHREIHRTALGSEDAVAWKYFEHTMEAVHFLKTEGYAIIAIEQAEGSISLADFKGQDFKKIALVFGNEIDGVSQEVMDVVDACIEIPQFGTKHSINVAVSAGIVIWQMSVEFIRLKAEGY
ncbi:MAG: RNA methyltransferase [Bacteroidota bacterium]